VPTYAEALVTRRAPAAVVVLAPSEWVATWKDAPRAPVAVGLRLLSEEETLTADAEATKEAIRGGRQTDDAVRRYNEALLCWIIGFAACDPNDATAPFFAFGDSDVRAAFPPATVRRLWEELELAATASSPSAPVATDEDLADLGMLLCCTTPLSGLSTQEATRARKWLGRILALLSPPSAD
jgi:hypothetical protein